MEILLRWVCPCRPLLESCPYCKGIAYFERWVPLDLVRYMTGGKSYVIVDRRLAVAPRLGTALSCRGWDSTIGRIGYDPIPCSDYQGLDKAAVYLN
jgi:hypothetical protein